MLFSNLKQKWYEKGYADGFKSCERQYVPRLEKAFTDGQLNIIDKIYKWLDKKEKEWNLK